MHGLLGIFTSVAFSPDGQRLVTAVAFSPDGRRVLTGSKDRTAKLWDAQTGRELVNLAHETEVTAVAVSPDGKRLLTACADGTFNVWTAEDWTKPF